MPGRLLDGDGAPVVLDDEGFLVRPEQWSIKVAEALAASDGVVLGKQHWWLIRMVRDHHQRYGNPPLMRVVVAAWREQFGSGSSRELYRLFPDGPVRLACKYGGLAKPDWCI
ncbi:TusE/DsrC/DsvC family sulfur relay protein [Wenzhouxiangella sp. AB-CW3]|uniref:TusE/DsrC/DsvC family sulfur relay protein n=1 Tax=Wenzhouxiangella sp. AB-CW3 TaxID=2771012 RepID=UPI001CC2DD7A|nr:TusE/DsrC/DsvC family sulfur relay protein [Wenzhouxiangella sp. AB-CW3]